MRSLDGITVVTLEHATMASAAIYTLNPNRWQPWMAGW
jgi:hypothetical protein